MRYVPPQRVSFLRRFGLKMGLDFAHFAVESGIVFEKTKGMYERIQEPILTYYKKLKEKYANSKWILRNLFCWRIFLNISKIAEKCSTSNVIKDQEQLNWRIMYVNLGAKVVVFP